MDLTLRKSFEKFGPAVVSISDIEVSPTNSSSNSFYTYGSGICVDPSGIIITAAHVVIPEDKKYIPDVSHIKIFQYAGIDNKGSSFITGSEAQMIVGVENFDVAFIKVKINSGNWPFINLENMTLDVREGDPIATAGYPMRGIEERNMKPNLFTGIVSRVDNKFLINQNGWAHENFVLDISLHPGNSGGPVFNHDGKLIGIVSSQRLREIENESGLRTWTNLVHCVPVSAFLNPLKEFKQKLENNK